MAQPILLHLLNWQILHKVFYLGYTHLLKLPTSCESHFATLILWMLPDLISVPSVDACSLLYPGSFELPSCLPCLHMCVFLCSRLFRIVYERQRVPKPELHRCKTGHLVEFHIPLELLSKQLCTPALSIMDILWINLSAWPQHAKQKQNREHNLIQTWTLHVFESLMTVLALLHFQQLSLCKPAWPVECG